MTPVNDNILPDFKIEDTFAMFDWVRPVCVAMRAQAIPEEVVQNVMGYLLERLDDHLEEQNGID